MEPGQTRMQSAAFHAVSDMGVHVRSNELRSYVTRQRSPDGRGADSKLSHALLRQGQGVWESASLQKSTAANPEESGDVCLREGPMAQLTVSWLVSDGRFRVHAINAVARRKGRIIEVEVVETGERFHGSARRLERLVHTLRRSSGELGSVPAWTPDTTS